MSIVKFLLLIAVAIVSLIKGIIFFIHAEYDQLLILVCIVAWVAWIVMAISKNKNLPGPFAYNEGKNQVARIGYGVVVIGLFFFYIFSK